MILGKVAKKYDAQFYQLKVGHGVIGNYSAKIGIIETSQCRRYGQAE